MAQLQKKAQKSFRDHKNRGDNSLSDRISQKPILMGDDGSFFRANEQGEVVKIKNHQEIKRIRSMLYF